MRASAADATEGHEKDKEGAGIIELEALAVAKRRRDMSRLSEQHGEASSADKDEAADDEMKVRGGRRREMEWWCVFPTLTVFCSE